MSNGLRHRQSSSCCKPPGWYSVVVWCGLVSLLSGTQAFAGASDIAATVLEVQQVSLVQPLGGARPSAVKAGQAIHNDETLITQPSGRLRLRLSSGKELLMAGSSRISMTEALQPEAGNSSKLIKSTRISMTQGALRMLTRGVQALADRDVTVVTPASLLAIRGTDFYVEVNPTDEKICLFEGAVDVTDANQKQSQLRKPYDFYRWDAGVKQSVVGVANAAQVKGWMSRFLNPPPLPNLPPPDTPPAQAEGRPTY